MKRLTRFLRKPYSLEYRLLNTPIALDRYVGGDRRFRTQAKALKHAQGFERFAWRLYRQLWDVRVVERQ